MHPQMVADLAHIQSRPDRAQWLAAWRSRQRWFHRFERDFGAVLATADRRLLPVVGRLLGQQTAKAEEPPPPAGRPLNVEEVIAALEAETAVDQFVQGAQALYVGMAMDAMGEAGQLTLDALGINKTWGWAGQRDFVRDALAVRGSKIIQEMYGNHLATLAAIIVAATAPASPKTIAQVTAQIREEWAAVARADAARIARTEVATVWERTNWYAMRANAVERVRWIVASGPAIGGKKSEPVCLACMEKAAGSPYRMDALDEIPPKHPNCRCTLVPVIDARWLPPMQPFTGAEEPLPTAGLDDAAGTRVPRVVPVMKANRHWGPVTPSGWSTAPGMGWMA